MRFRKSLLCAASALTLATGAAFAGQDSTIYGSVDTSSPELLSEQYNDRLDGSLESRMPMNMSEDAQSSRPSELALEEGDVLYIYPVEIYPVEITEYYLIVPEPDNSGDSWG